MLSCSVLNQFLFVTFRNTQPQSFWISVFSKQAHPISSQNGNYLNKGEEYYVFAPIADPFPYKEGIEDTFVPIKEVEFYLYFYYYYIISLFADYSIVYYQYIGNPWDI